jgi:hypothetical protein
MMNMKKIKYFLNGCLALLTALVFSCQSLEENPAGVLVAESFFQSTADLDAAVAATYRQLAENTWGGLCHTNVWTLMFGADDLTSASNRTAYLEFDRFAATDMNGSLKAAYWDRPYGCIFDANNVINNYERVQGNETYILNKAGEAYFLRAWSYFWLVRSFGEIPMPLSTDLDYTLPLTPVAEVYRQIISDLEFAIAHLPRDRGYYEGRPCQWSAKALLAQVYLTMAGWPLKDESKYAPAAALAKEVMESNQYRLLENYGDLWMDASDNHDEVVWSIQLCNMLDCGLPVRCTFIGLNTMPSEERGWDQVFCEVGFYNRFPEGVRKDETFWTDFETRESSAPWTILKTTHFSESLQKHPFLKKYRDGYSGEPNWNGDSDHMGGRDVNYLRYAEVLLMYAEAQVMSEGTPNELAYQCIDRTRIRAGLPPFDRNVKDKIAFRDSVIAERGWEFCGEYCRWFDLVRTEKVAEMNSYKEEVDFKPLNPIEPSRYWAPIPGTEVALNPNLRK